MSDPGAILGVRKEHDVPSRPTATARKPRDRYHALLQIAGCVAVFASHSGFSFLRVGWLAVEMFFVFAGYHMFASIGKHESLLGFARHRYLRLLPAVLIVWPLVVLCAVTTGSPGSMKFLFLAPLFLQNFIPLEQTNWFGGDVVWTSLWFLAAVLQIQFCVWPLRRWITVARAEWVLAIALLVGFASRYCAWKFVGQGAGTMNMSQAAQIFWFPSTHAEAFVVGALLGCGAMRFTRVLPFAVVFLMVYVVATYLGFGATPETAAFSMNRERVWGLLVYYPVLALVAGSFVDPSNALARWVNGLRVPPILDTLNGKLSSVTFHAYALHGAVLVVLWRVLAIPGVSIYHWSPSRIALLFVLCTVCSFAAALLVARLPFMRPPKRTRPAKEV